MRQVQRTHYQVLGVEPSASAAEIRQAYRHLAYRLHPDRQAGASPAEQRLAERRMREVNIAWTALSDTHRRADYDRSISRAPSSAATRRPTPTPTPTPAPARDAAGDRAVRSDTDDDDDEDDPNLSTAGLWAFRRGPIVVVLAIGLVIFIGTAYAGRGTSPPPRSTVAPAVVANSDCVKFMQDHMAYTVSCDGRYDATIVRDEPNAIACAPDGLDYAVVASKSVCVRAR